MILLVMGLLLWSAAHFTPAIGQRLRTRVVAASGENPYKGVFSLLTCGFDCVDGVRLALDGACIGLSAACMGPNGRHGAGRGRFDIVLCGPHADQPQTYPSASAAYRCIAVERRALARSRFSRGSGYGRLPRCCSSTAATVPGSNLDRSHSEAMS